MINSYSTAQQALMSLTGSLANLSLTRLLSFSSLLLASLTLNTSDKQRRSRYRAFRSSLFDWDDSSAPDFVLDPIVRNESTFFVGAFTLFRLRNAQQSWG